MFVKYCSPFAVIALFSMYMASDSGQKRIRTKLEATKKYQQDPREEENSEIMRKIIFERYNPLIKKE